MKSDASTGAVDIFSINRKLIGGEERCLPVDQGQSLTKKDVVKCELEQMQ